MPAITSLTTDGSTARERVGIVQIVDPFGNPVVQHEELKVSLSTTNATTTDTEEEEEEVSESEVLRVPQKVTIREGESYTDFYITVFGKPGSETIYASAEGIQTGSTVEIGVSEFFKQLLLYVPPIDQVEVGEELTVDLFVDDEYGDSIEGVDVMITPTNVTVTPTSTTTNDFGGFTITLLPENTEASLLIQVSKFGYISDSKTMTVDVLGEAVNEKTTLFGVDPIILYLAIGGMVAAVGGMAFKFLRKPPEAPEEEEEEL